MKLPLVFELPLPPSPDRAPRDPIARTAWKNRTKRRTWFHACEQAAPTGDPPPVVRLVAHFRVVNLRDDDNLMASLKYVIDSLRLARPTENERFKAGLHLGKAYFAGDEPLRCFVERPEQCIDRFAPGLRLEIHEWEGPPEEET